MSRFRVLIVDDELDFLETIVKRLERRGIEASGAKSAEEAIEQMKQKRVDVILLDIKMPGGMDGIEAFRQMKKIQPLAEVIFLTGHATVETSIEGLKLGAFDYLIKPVKLEDLLPKLAEAFERKNAQEQKIRSFQIQELLHRPDKDSDPEGGFRP